MSILLASHFLQHCFVKWCPDGFPLIALFFLLCVFLFYFQKSIDAQVLLTKNMIKANKEMTFAIVSKAFGIQPLLQEHLSGYRADLSQVLVWAIREARLHQSVSDTLVFNLKLDGRPLAGTIFSVINNDTFTHFWYIIIHGKVWRSYLLFLMFHFGHHC